MNKYIDVNEQLPKNSGFYDVLLDGKREAYIPYVRQASGKMIWMTPDWFLSSVTHWKSRETNLPNMEALQETDLKNIAEKGTSNNL